jgi:hypothetical protein
MKGQVIVNGDVVHFGVKVNGILRVPTYTDRMIAEQVKMQIQTENTNIAVEVVAVTSEGKELLLG